MIINELIKESSLAVGVAPDDVFYVPMGRCSSSSEKKPCLYTFGIASCVGLLAKADNFAFLAHIDIGGHLGEDFECNWYQLPGGKWDVRFIKCNTTEKMLQAIRRSTIISPIEISLIYGDFYFASGSIQEDLLNKGIDRAIMVCESMGLECVRTEPIYSSSVLVDSRSGKIFLSDVLEANDKAEFVEERFDSKVSGHELESMLVENKGRLASFLEKFKK